MNKVILFCLLFINSLGYADLPNFPFITVTGMAEKEVAPDMVNISFHLIEFNEDPKKAMSVIFKTGLSVIKLAEHYKIPKDKIISHAINKVIKREQNAEYTNLEIEGYEVQQDFNIELVDIKNFSSFTNNLLIMRNVSGIKINFDTKNREKILHNLVKKAGMDAKKKAENLAESLGVVLGKVYAITGNTGFSSALATFEHVDSNGLQGVYFSSAAFVPWGGNSSNLFTPKNIKISKVVNIIFRINEQ